MDMAPRSNLHVNLDKPATALRSVSANVMEAPGYGADSDVAALPLPPVGRPANRRSQTYGLGLGLAPAGRAYGGVAGPFGRTCSAPLAAQSTADLLTFGMDEGARNHGYFFMGVERDPVWWAGGGKVVASPVEHSRWSDDESDGSSLVAADDTDSDEAADGHASCEVRTVDLDLGAFMSPSAGSIGSSASPALLAFGGHVFSPRNAALAKRLDHHPARASSPAVYPSTPEDYAFLISAIDFSTLVPTSPVSELSSSPMARSSGEHSRAVPRVTRKSASSATLNGASRPPTTTIRPQASAPSLGAVASAMQRSSTVVSQVAPSDQSSTGSTSELDSLFSPALSHASSRTSMLSANSLQKRVAEPALPRTSVIDRGRPVPSANRVASFGAPRHHELLARRNLSRHSPLPTDAKDGGVSQPSDPACTETADLHVPSPATRRTRLESMSSCAASIIDLGGGDEGRAGAPRRESVATQRSLIVRQWLEAEHRRSGVQGITQPHAAGDAGKGKAGFGQKLKRFFSSTAAPAKADASARSTGKPVKQGRSEDVFEPRLGVKRVPSIEQVLLSTPA